MNNTEFVVLVDEQNREIGIEEKLSAHKNGSLHRAFSIFIFRWRNQQIELLLQQRNKAKYHCGNLWTNTCCGHPRKGEDFAVAASRRLMEEMNFTTHLQYLDKFLYFANCNNDLIEHEIDHVLIGKYDNDIISPNPQEVQNYKWINLTDLQVELLKSKASFTPWFNQALAVVSDNWQQVTALFQDIAQEESTIW